MRKLTIVVNCTDRKSIKPADDLRVRSLPPGAPSERFSVWRQRVTRATPRLRLMDLYQGEAWGQAKALASDAGARGTSVRMVVASAGLGLRDVTRLAPSYAATFAGGHDDSVAPHPKLLPYWWGRLSELPDTISPAELAKGSVLFVLSESYARAMDADLVEVGKNGGDHLLVGGWRSIDGLPRLPADRSLRKALGGTVSSLNLRMARRWMAERSEASLHAAEDRKRWSRWVRKVAHSENYQRHPMTDMELVEVIGALISDEPTLSATRALRIVRDRGGACEQKRFGVLFREVADAR